MSFGAGRTEDFHVPVVIAQYDRVESGSIQVAEECEHTRLRPTNGARNLQASAMQHQ